MKKYSFRLKTYLKCSFILLTIVIFGYFVAPILINFPPHSGDIYFQESIGTMGHFEQYILLFVILIVTTLSFISFLYRDIFKLYEGKKITKSMTEVRESTFTFSQKYIIMQIIVMIFVCVLSYLITPYSELITYIKLGIFYVALGTCGSVIANFVLSYDLKKFFIYSNKYEANYIFNFKKVSFKNLIMQRLSPLIMVIIVILSFLSYTYVIREIAINNFKYYRIEFKNLDLDNLNIDQVIEQLRTVDRINPDNDFFFYSLDRENFITEDGQEMSLFFREYIKAFSEITEGRVYDFYGVEREGYVRTLVLSTGEEIYVGFSFSTGDNGALLLFIGLFIVTIITSIAYLRAFASNITMDITDVSNNLNKIAKNEGNSLIEKISISSNDEIGEIVSAYNKIQELNHNHINDLNLAKEQAEKANNYKTEFLSSMSHEIRTPLNVIVGLSQSLTESDKITGELEQDVNDIIVASNILLDIVNGILDISKIEANKLEIINHDYNPLKMFEELTSLARARMGDKMLDFRVVFDPAIPQILYGDQARIKQVILNLLTNAIKYTKEGFIEFKVSSVVKDNICRLIITIEDSGVGIKTEDINKLFRKFERLNEGGTSSIEGTGLGLAITKKLIELMGGQIVVQSVFGQGSKFSVAINQRIIAVEQVETERLIDTAMMKTLDFSNKKVLLVDDNRLNLKVAKRLLMKFGFEIEAIDNGYDCINKIEAGEKYNLILLDDMMPGMSGTEALNILRKNPDFKIPVVVLTANAITGMREKYLEAGFDDYLAKPIDKQELYRVLAHFLFNQE